MEQIILYLQGLDPVLLYPFLAFIVFLGVKIASALGFLKDGTMQRVGVLVGTFLTSGMVDELEQGIVAIIIGLLSVGMNEFSGWAVKKVSK